MIPYILHNWYYHQFLLQTFWLIFLSVLLRFLTFLSFLILQVLSNCLLTLLFPKLQLFLFVPVYGNVPQVSWQSFALLSNRIFAVQSGLQYRSSVFRPHRLCAQKRGHSGLQSRKFDKQPCGSSCSSILVRRSCVVVRDKTQAVLTHPRSPCLETLSAPWHGDPYSFAWCCVQFRTWRSKTNNTENNKNFRNISARNFHTLHGCSCTLLWLIHQSSRLDKNSSADLSDRHFWALR